MHKKNSIITDNIKVVAYHLQHTETELVSVNITKNTDFVTNENSFGDISNKIEISTSSNLENIDKFISYIDYTSKTLDFEGKLLYSISFKLKGTSIKSDEFKLLDNDEIEQFTNIVAIRSMWPYLRETLSNITSRMRVPIIEIPTIDIMETYGK